MKADFDSKILAVMESNPQGLSILRVSKLCQINRRTAKRHLEILVQKGKAIQHIIHKKMYLFLPAEGETWIR